MLEKLESGVWLRESSVDVEMVLVVPLRVELAGEKSPSPGLRRCLSSRSLRLEVDDQCPGDISPPARPLGASSPPSTPDHPDPHEAPPADPRLDNGVSFLLPSILAGALAAPIEALRSAARCLNASRSGLPSATRFLKRPKTPPDFAGFLGEDDSARLVAEATGRRADMDCVPTATGREWEELRVLDEGRCE